MLGHAPLKGMQWYLYYPELVASGMGRSRRILSAISGTRAELGRS